MSKRYTISVDFDGVLHQWDGNYQGAHVIHGDPVPGAIEWLLRMLQRFDVVIHSTRCNTWRGRRAIRKWLRSQSGMAWHDSPAGLGTESVRVMLGKQPSLVYIDDRAWRFHPEHWPTRRDVHQARPWHKDGSAA